jgi:hypothetical protein
MTRYSTGKAARSKPWCLSAGAHLGCNTIYCQQTSPDQVRTWGTPELESAITTETAVLAQVAKGDQLRIEDRDGETAQFASTMTVTRVTSDKVFCGSTAYRKSDGQEMGGNDHMFAMPVTATKKPDKAKPQDSPTKMRGSDAAAKVLAEAGKPMNCRDLIAG